MEKILKETHQSRPSFVIIPKEEEGIVSKKVGGNKNLKVIKNIIKRALQPVDNWALGFNFEAYQKFPFEKDFSDKDKNVLENLSIKGFLKKEGESFWVTEKLVNILKEFFVIPKIKVEI